MKQENIQTVLKEIKQEFDRLREATDYIEQSKEEVEEVLRFTKTSSNNLISKFEQIIDKIDLPITQFNELSVKSVQLIKKIETINFPERLDSIEKSVGDTISNLNETRKATIEELQLAAEIITEADFDGRFKKLQSSIDSSVKSSERLAFSIEKQKLPERIESLHSIITQKLENSISDLQKNTKQIATDTAKSIHNLNLPIRIDKLDANISGILSAIQNVQGRIESVERNIGDKLKDATDKQALSLVSLQEKLNQSIMALQQEIITSAKKQKANTYITWALILGTLAIFFIYKLFFAAKI